MATGVFGQLGREDARQCGPLSDKERAEADNLNADGIAAIKDVAKLRRFEAYFRQEGFEPTADVIRRRIVDLGQVDPLHDPHQDQEARADLDSYRTGLQSWTAAAKTAEKELLAHKLSGAASGRAVPAPRARAYIPTANEEKLQAAADTAKDQERTSHTGKPDSKFGGQLRSGSEYYKNWDKFAEQALAQQEQEDADMPRGSSKVPAAKPRSTAAANGGVSGSQTQQAAAGALRTQELLDLNLSTMTLQERRYQAESERNKGNEYFRTGSYRDAVEHYTLGLGYTPNNVSLHANRAAAYLKLKMYKEAIQDCDKALELDSQYVKALVRRALARLELNYNLEALSDVEAALVLEPQNKELASMLSRACTALGLKPAKTRIAVEEGDSEEDEAPSAQQQAVQTPAAKTRLVVQEDSDEDEGHTQKAPAAAAADAVQKPEQPATDAPAQPVEQQSKRSMAQQGAGAAAAAVSASEQQQEQLPKAQGQASQRLPGRTVLQVVDESDDDAEFFSAGSTSSQSPAQPHAPSVDAAQQPKPPAAPIPGTKQTPAADQLKPALATAPAPTKTAASPKTGMEAPAPASTAVQAAKVTAAPAPSPATKPTLAAQPPTSQAPVPVEQQTAPAAAAAAAAPPPPAAEPTVEERVATMKAHAFKCMTVGDQKGAIEQYTQALKLQPDNVELYIDRSFAKLKGNDGKSALMDAATAVQLDGDSARAMHARAQAKLMLGLTTAAHIDLEEAQELPCSSSLKADIKREASKVAQMLAKKAAAGPRVTKKATLGERRHVVIEEHADQEEEGALISSAQLSRLEGEAVGRAMRAKKQAQSLQDQAAAAAALVAQQQAQAEEAAASAVDQGQAQEVATAAADDMAPPDMAPSVLPSTAKPAAVPSTSTAARQSAEDLKAAGNTAYAGGDLELARDMWEQALAAAEPGGDLARACNVNLATVTLELGDAQAALNHANTVLQAEPGHVKAMFRQAMSFKALGRLHDAAESLRRVKAERGQSELVDQELAAIAERLAAEDSQAAQQHQPQSQQEVRPPSTAQEPHVAAQPTPTENEAEQADEAEARAQACTVSAAPTLPEQQQADATSVQQTEQPVLNYQAAAAQAVEQAVEQAASEAREQGNALFRQGKLQEAMDMYTHSLAAKPTKEVYSNMALVQLKLEQNVEAEASCHAALRLDSKYTKATYRLALVMRAKGQRQQEATLLRECISQLTAAAQAGEPTARGELQNVQNALEQVEKHLAQMGSVAPPPAQSKTTDTLVRNKISITEVSESDSEDSHPIAAAAGIKQQERQHGRQAPVGNGKAQMHAVTAVAAASHVRPSSSGEGSARSSDAGSSSGPHHSGSRSSSSRGGLDQQKVAAAVASLAKEGLPPPPRNATEFLNGCKTLSNDQQRLAAYIKAIEPATYPAVFKQALDNMCMSYLLRALSHVAEEDTTFACQALQQLSHVPRFSMVAAMLKPVDKSAVLDILEAAESSQGIDTSSLRKTYRA